jgi:hypothetical protein
MTTIRVPERHSAAIASAAVLSYADVAAAALSRTTGARL